MSTITIAGVSDGANFFNTLIERAFTDQQEAFNWAERQASLFQLKRRAEGETDEVFIAAIASYHRQIEFDNADLQHPGKSFK